MFTATTLGAVFSFTTKSGTNQFRGSLFEYFTNEARRSTAFGRQANHPKLYDGRDKKIFFFNYERFRVSTRAAGTYGTLPSEPFRNGDLSSFLTGRQLPGSDPLARPIFENVIYDPQTERTAPNGQLVRDPFPNNMIPRNRFDPVALKILSLIPGADRPGDTLN